MSKQSESVESTGTEILQESQQSTASDDAVSRRSDPWATLTAHEQLLLGGDPAFDLRQVARRAGTGLDLAQRFWQAMGFADVDPDAVRFTERDVEALCGVADLIDEHDDGAPSPSAPGGGLAASSVLELLRAQSYTMDRLVLWQFETLVADISDRHAVLPARGNRGPDVESRVRTEYRITEMRWRNGELADQIGLTTPTVAPSA